MKEDGMAACDVEVVLFDFGGVLAEEGFVEGLAAIARENGLDEKTFVEWGHELVHETGFVSGRGDEGAYWAALRRRSGIRGSDKELRNEILSRFVLRPWMLRVVEALRSRSVKTGILSDQTSWLDELESEHGFYRLFDRVFNSYHLGKSKQDPSHFDDVARLLRVPPERILFVDDNRGHVERAAARGMKTIWYRNRDDFMSRLRRYCPLMEAPS